MLYLVACSKPSKTVEVLTPAAFCADSAYAYVSAQVAFGARVPGTEAHKACEQYLVEQLTRFGAEVSIQEGSLPNYAGEQQPIRNIIARFGTTSTSHVEETGVPGGTTMLCAHWDCRPWCDQEQDPALWQTPVLGANDGASGVGVLLEVARQLSLLDSVPSVEIVFFDAEDMGTPEFYEGPQRPNSWCLGSQLYAQELLARKSVRMASPECPEAPECSEAPREGILLDMVGAPDAVFPKEYFSMHFAPSLTEKVWRMGARLGFGRYFSPEKGSAITDDHYFVNTIAGVPCIDIIHYSHQSGTGFPAYWHTTHDDMSNVSVATLHAVGTTVMTYVLR